LLKTTDESHPDYQALKQACDSICSSVSIINEQKREQEKSMQLLQIQNSIESSSKGEVRYCLVTVISIDRSIERA
jgi:hypothetical protein